MSLENSRVLVVGGSSGIGLGIAMICAEKNAQVIISSRSQEKLNSSASKIRNCAGYEVVDVLSSESVESLFKKVGNIDHLVVTSGSVTAKKFNELVEEEAKRDFELNFWGKYRLAKSGASYINKGGSITFISGAFAKRPNPNVFITSVAVSSIETMTKTLALSIAPIRVNAIAPYVIDTSIVSEDQPSEDRKKFIESTSEKLASKYVGTPFDVGEVVAMVISNPYITGSIIPIDGGFTI